MKPLISIIIPVYNAEKCLNKCIDSILNQTFKNYELVLINDGSTDNSKEICEDYLTKDNRIIVINKDNGGVSKARNIGLDTAKGDYVLFVDSDDWIENKCLDLLYSKTSVDVDYVIYGYYRVSFNQISPVRLKFNQELLDRNFIVKNIIGNLNKIIYPFNGINSVCNKLYKRSFIGNLRFDESRSHGEDWWFNVCLYDKAQKIVVIDECLYYYTINNNQNSLSKKFDYKLVDRLLTTNHEFVNLLKKYNLSEIESNTGKLSGILDVLMKAYQQMNKKDFKRFYRDFIHDDRLQKLIQLPHDLKGKHLILINNMNNSYFVYTMISLLVMKDKVKQLIKKAA